MRSLPVFALLALLACKDREQVVVTPPPVEPQRPAWVVSRPVSSLDYIGIGLASKSRADHQETAKKNALNDLASEISVIVEGNSLLYTLDRRSSFDESFSSTIRTRTTEQLEGFELVDTWENANEYWVYYRLSKARHAQIKAERKARAIGIATDLLTRSRASLQGGDLKGAFDQGLRGLIAMKEHWGENDLVDVGGKQVPLVNELYSDLQKLTAGVQFAVLPERCVLDHGNGYKRELLITATYAANGRALDLVQLPVSIVYPGISGKVTELKTTDTEGRLRTTVQRVAREPGKAPEVVVRLNMDELVSKEQDPVLTKGVVASLTVPEKHIPIDLVMPKVFISATETNLGQPIGDAGLAQVVREEFTARGLRFVDRERDADLLLDLSSSTRQGGESNGFFTAHLDMSLTFRDRRTREVLHEGGRQGVKGVQLNYEKAGLDAYKKAAQDLRKDIVPAMIDGIF
jgi:hypothetical protein